MSKLPICFALIMTLGQLERRDTIGQILLMDLHYYACMVWVRMTIFGMVLVTQVGRSIFMCELTGFGHWGVRGRGEGYEIDWAIRP